MGVFPIFFKRWNEINVAPNYGTIENCIEVILHDLFSLDFKRFISRIFDVIDRYIVTGVVTGALGYVIWILSLKFGEVNILFSITSLQFVATGVLAYSYLKERLSKREIFGMALIILGVALLAPQL
jgi:drug/metabolite transporter (DMT)-like permease